MKKLLFTLLFSFTIAVGIKGTFYHGPVQFHLKEIRSVGEKIFSPEMTPERVEEIKRLLSQPFKYLNKGKQCWVFESEDQEFVIKFFKQKHLAPKKEWLLSLPLPAALRKKWEGRNAQKSQSRERIFESCRLAYAKAQKETALIYLQLAPSPSFKQKIMLVDRFGLSYPLDIENYEFILQKRVTALKDYVSQKVPTVAERTLLSTRVLEAIEALKAKKIVDLDKNSAENVGIAEHSGEIIFMDFGFFSEENDISQNAEPKISSR